MKMVIDNSSIQNSFELACRHVSGGSITSHSPLFSTDNKILYVTWGEVIRAYSVQTGELIRGYRGLNDRAIGIQFHPLNSDYLVALSQKGILVQWSVITGEQLKKSVKLKLPSKTVAKAFVMIPNDNSDDCSLYVTYKSLQDQYLRLNGFREATGLSLNRLQLSIKKFRITDCLHNISSGCVEGVHYIAGIFKSKLRIYNLKQYYHKYHKIGGGRSFTCVSCHPTEPVVATGDDCGRVLLWYQFLSHGDKAVHTVYHWHTLPVNVVTFSKEGSYFYSGGSERVLVKWTRNTAYKKFFPRLPASINHISLAQENEFLSLSTADNGIFLLDSQLKHQTFIQNFTCQETGPGIDERNLFPCGLHYEPRTKALVTNGRVGHIQFFNPMTSSLLFNLDITGQNYLTNLRNNVVVNTDVSRLALSGDGMWMGTVEERMDNETNLELRLKFWSFDTVTQSFFLNTSLEMPHTSRISTIQFQPCSETLAVTAGEDMKFRTWRAAEIDSVYKKGIVWSCESVGFFRNLPIGSVAFSSDGSLLAVGFDYILTLWDPDSFKLKYTLSHCQLKTSIRHVQFGVLNHSHLLAVATCNSIGVWDLLTLTLAWVVPITVDILVVDPLSSVMAAFSSNSLFIFSLSSCKPLFSKNKVCRRSGKVLSAVFIPSYRSVTPSHSPTWWKNSQLYFLTSKQEVFLTDTEESMDNEEKDVENLDTLPHTSGGSSLTPFGALIAQQTTSHVQSASSKIHLQLGLPGDMAVKELMKAPAQTMLSVSRLAESFLLSFVMGSGHQKEEVEAVRGEYDRDKDEEDSDEDKDTTPFKNRRTSLSERKNVKKTEPGASANVVLEEKLSQIMTESNDWTSLLC